MQGEKERARQSDGFALGHSVLLAALASCNDVYVLPPFQTFSLEQSALEHRQCKLDWLGRVPGRLILSSPDATDTCNYSNSVDARLAARVGPPAPHGGCHTAVGTHYDSLMTSTSSALPLLATTPFPLAWPEAFVAKRECRGTLSFRIEDEPVMIAAYAVLRRTICREEFDSTSPTSATLEKGQVITVSEQKPNKKAPNLGLRVKSPHGASLDCVVGSYYVLSLSCSSCRITSDES